MDKEPTNYHLVPRFRHKCGFDFNPVEYSKWNYCPGCGEPLKA